ncbi:putative phosphotransferase Ecym_4313 [Eremothecium cymbalariae DBVPG|uniref:Carbohydrate kinase FGGY C-terminal domain-containing protein n=1 Tax=Eremothecium cymbalariae (strain CBS 270.75 / DBVPG 7215 / KCTC 17166 / NRRL Y-17582) TaxID=931890 RepID=G8JTM3_ERECY|nr:hypothetical protein Ecym_4313 [Eremothecium cymbalariae DBVPG\
MLQHYIGVDVGTESVRACVVDVHGTILSLASKPISRQEIQPNYLTQSSNEIWRAICFCIRKIICDSQVVKDSIIGIGFDATCSLVVLEEVTNKGVAVGPNFDDFEQDIILWMDHRAIDEVNEINSTGHRCLKYVGGKMSIEMQIPKIKWLKNNLPQGKFDKCEFYDLPDFLTYRATGNKCRSFCSTVCKMGLLPLGVDGSTKGWPQDLFEDIGLAELCRREFSKLGGVVSSTASNFLSAGDYVGHLSDEAAADLGLTTKCIVASGLIDAYAGWVGTIAAGITLGSDGQESELASSRLATVAGTSTCHITISKCPHFMDGVWGPYRDALMPGYWVTEGGQSCTGALLAHVLKSHPAYDTLCKLAKNQGISKFDFINNRLEELKEERGAQSVAALGKHLFFYGDYHGNRSPIADPNMRATIIGQSMDVSVDDLAIMTLGACEFIAQQTRQIVEHIKQSGHEITSIYMSGGQCRNLVLIKLLANCTKLPIVLPKYIDAAVVFGSALLGVAASEKYLHGCSDTASVSTIVDQQRITSELKPKQSILWTVMANLTGIGQIIEPSNMLDSEIRLLDQKYEIFLDMIETQKRYRDLVTRAENSV